MPELPNTRPLRDVTDETERNPKRSVYLRRARRRFQKLLVDTVIDQIEHEHQDPVPPVADMWRGVLYQAIRDAAAGDMKARRYWWTPDFIEVCRLACVKPERVRQIIVRRGWGDRPFDRDSFRWPTLTLKKRPSAAVAS